MAPPEQKDTTILMSHYVFEMSGIIITSFGFGENNFGANSNFQVKGLLQRKERKNVYTVSLDISSYILAYLCTTQFS